MTVEERRDAFEKIRSYREMYSGINGQEILAMNLKSFVFARKGAEDLPNTYMSVGERNFFLAQLECMGLLSDDNIRRIAAFMLTLPMPDELVKDDEINT